MNKPFGVCLLPVLLSPAVALAKRASEKGDEEIGEVTYGRLR